MGSRGKAEGCRIGAYLGEQPFEPAGVPRARSLMVATVVGFVGVVGFFDSTAFENLDCVAFDLAHDPGMIQPIRPMLVGSEGISRKLSVPFLEPLKAHDSFAVLLKCALPRCVKVGFGYYTSTLSFTQDRVRQCEVRLIFAGSTPS